MIMAMITQAFRYAYEPIVFAKGKDKDKNEYYFEAAGKRIQLSAEEAELLERVNRYAEERRERMTQANEDRLERRATLDFEHRMQERREQVAQQIEELKVKYEHELSMRDRDLDLQKLMAELQYHTAAGAQSADVQKTQANAEAAARIAEAEAAAKRLEEQLKREESIAERAEEFKKALMEIQAALEMTRLGNERNRDDRQAEVGIATAQAAAKARDDKPAGMTDKQKDRMRDLEKQVDRIVNSVSDLRRQVRELWKRIPPYWNPSTPPVNPWTPQPHYVSTPAAPAQPSAPVPPTAQPGALPARKCPTCGQSVDASAGNCPYCGTPLL